MVNGSDLSVLLRNRNQQYTEKRKSWIKNSPISRIFAKRRYLIDLIVKGMWNPG